MQMVLQLWIGLNMGYIRGWGIISILSQFAADGFAGDAENLCRPLLVASCIFQSSVDNLLFYVPKRRANLKGYVSGQFFSGGEEQAVW